MLDIDVIGSGGFVCFGSFDGSYGLVYCDGDGFTGEFTDASEDGSGILLGFVWLDVGKLFGEMVALSRFVVAVCPLKSIVLLG